MNSMQQANEPAHAVDPAVGLQVGHDEGLYESNQSEGGKAEQ
jgi:hypothetical protein